MLDSRSSDRTDNAALIFLRQWCNKKQGTEKLCLPISKSKQAPPALSAASIDTKWSCKVSISHGLTRSSLDLCFQYKSLSPGSFGGHHNLCKVEKKLILMEGASKFVCHLVLFMVVVSPALLGADGAGECGRVSADRMAFRMAPCAQATQDASAPVSDRCCAEVRKLGQTPSCLCAVMLSNTARSIGARPEVAITIPKRCNIADRPVGYKCGEHSTIQQNGWASLVGWATKAHHGGSGSRMRFGAVEA
ncbi:hypothetical protein Taro_021894 [Colocasia esculenta]|uniref:Bifunctional inhibitor/plant lipid transfer protein/seed storage helical domain-containing protein n=1 Tax=Colocasia esculenta TaxID=4460 RepID=A0A843VCV2_COLES|nr:hypothetical protein [Colocasia esculenta]